MSENNGTSNEGRDSALEAVAQYVFEVGHLKQTPRSGWALAGIDRPESVADHSFRTAIIGYVLARLENADPGRTVMICLFHDTTETRLGDIPSVGKRYTTASPEQVVSDQTRALPTALRKGIGDLVLSYEEATGSEALLAKDADKLECLAQAVQYVESGKPQAKSWIAALASELSSPSAIEMANAIQAVGADTWWKGFVQNYRSTTT